MVVVVAAEAVAIALLALLVVGLLRSHAEILRALHDLGAGVEPGGRRTADLPDPVQWGVHEGSETGHDIVGVTPGAEGVALSVVGAAQDSLLAFLSTGCGTCGPFWDAFAAGVAVPGGARLVVVTQGPEAESEARVAELAPPDVAVVMSSQAWADYQVPGSPHFVYVRRDGVVTGEGTGGSWRQVADLLDQASADAAHRPPADRDNPARIDQELAAAGIAAGHPSLYASPDPDEAR